MDLQAGLVSLGVCPFHCNNWKMGQCQRRPSMTWHDMTWHDMTWHDMTWHDMTRHDTTRHDTTRHDTARHGTARHGPTRHDTTRHDTTRHDTTKSRHDQTRQSNSVYWSIVKTKTVPLKQTLSAVLSTHSHTPWQWLTTAPAWRNLHQPTSNIYTT